MVGCVRYVELIEPALLHLLPASSQTTSDFFFFKILHTVLIGSNSEEHNRAISFILLCSVANILIVFIIIFYENIQLKEPSFMRTLRSANNSLQFQEPLKVARYH